MTSQKLPYPELPDLKVISKAEEADTEIVLCFQDAAGSMVLPRGSHKTLLERLKKDAAYSAKHAATELVRFGGTEKATHLLAVGCGKSAEFTEEKARSAGGHAYQRIKTAASESVVIRLDALEDSDWGTDGQKADLAKAFLEGFLLGHYSFKHHKGTPDNSRKGELKKILLNCGDKEMKQTLLKEKENLTATLEAINVTRHWSNEPSNTGTPEFYGQEATRLAKEFGLKIRVLNEKECAREKMNLFLSVGKGSDREVRFVILEHIPKGKQKKKKLALVGKGVTFDSGGISIKPATKMEEMKHDMTGAATVMGAMILAAKWNVPHHVIGIMAFTENMPNGIATQPGNVVRGRSGKTVEIINTDAEGRLVLADALDYVQDMKPDVVINIATLTGAASICFGKYCTGVMGNDQDLIDSLRAVGDRTGERLWPLPLFDEYLEDIRSPVADIQNVGAPAQAGTIAGGMFLKQFIRKGVKWAHLDIANVAYNLSHLSYFPKRGANGIMVRLLAQYLRSA